MESSHMQKLKNSFRLVLDENTFFLGHAELR